MVELEKRNRLSPDMNGIGTFIFRRLVLQVRALMLYRKKEDAPLLSTSAIIGIDLLQSDQPFLHCSSKTRLS